MPQQALVAATTQFAVRLYGDLVQRREGVNTFLSPLSVALALSMAYAGASGETALAMANALHFHGMSQDEVARQAGGLIQQLHALDGAGNNQAASMAGRSDPISLRIANALFVNKQIAFRQDYVASCRQLYQAYLEQLDFGAPSAGTTIDRWVSEQTRGKITNIAGSLDPRMVAVLINAIYFKAPWRYPFLEQLTTDQPFHLLDGTQKRVRMMSNDDRYLYRRADNFEIVGLPFGARGDVTMLVFLPSKHSSLNELQRIIVATDPAVWAQWGLRETKVRLKLPRFRIEFDTALNASLAALGMQQAFEPGRADFSGMIESKRQFYISEVRHKTYIDVNEKGAEAAAATSVKMALASFMPERPIEVVVDRPFICAIQDRKTNALLFVGSIVNP
jgi:serpin B